MKSDAIYETAKQYMVAGVSASGRYHPSLHKPLILESADGCILKDVDGNEWIDYHSSSGATILGFNHPAIKDALLRSLEMGFFINYESEFHTQLAAQISKMVPSAEKIRLVNSGTEATLAALRIARAYTGKKKIIKFEGHFHGMHEFVFYNWHNNLGYMNSGGEIEKVRDTAGMVSELDDLLIVIPYNDIEILENTIAKYNQNLAAVILEPVMYNAGCIEPKPGYLQKVREITAKNDVLLIFDEVLSGFRMHPGCAQGYYNVIPDLTALGKVLGCGMAVAALAGKTEIMQHLSPLGPVAVSGTYSGHLMGVMGALAGLKAVASPGFYDDLNKKAEYFYRMVNELFRKTGLKGILQGLGARFGMYFGLDHHTYDYRDAAEHYNLNAGRRFFELAMKKHLYFHNFGDGLTPMHSGITSTHTIPILDETLNRFDDIFAQMVKEGL